MCKSFISAILAAFIVSPSSSAQSTELFWGDTHLHTSNSADTYENGVVNADIETAYRFARGFPVIHPATGHRIRMDKPLDFLVVADHAEMLSLQNRIAANDPLILDTPAGRRLQGIFEEDVTSIFDQVLEMSLLGTNQDILEQLHTPAVRRPAWLDQVEAAERNNTPGVFTAFIGWEWSSTANRINLHRVLFTADGAEVAENFLPFSSYDSENPEDLWAWMAETEERTGARLLAIPHNSNFSNGAMFSESDSDGRPISAEYALTRSRWEPVAEVTQYKGTSEIHPALTTTDEFAGFEIRDDLFGVKSATDPGAYLRTALLRGLEIENKVGENPYQLGMIGSTDSHTGFTSVDEEAFLGKTGMDFLPDQRETRGIGNFNAWNVAASGLVGVWAEENSRDILFNAFVRKEVYATSGPRISLRFFAGFDFSEPDLESSDFVSVGYNKGVPMGGDLSHAPEGVSPSFLIEAVQEATGASLDRVQVIKGWVDETGVGQEKIFDVAWSGDARMDNSGDLAPIRNTVDLETATYTNDFGASMLRTFWSDPEFNAEQNAFYYLRVLQIPTPRHHVYDAVALGVDPNIDEGPSTIQERAWSSPIWYRPE